MENELWYKKRKCRLERRAMISQCSPATEEKAGKEEKDKEEAEKEKMMATETKAMGNLTSSRKRAKGGRSGMA